MVRDVLRVIAPLYRRSHPAPERGGGRREEGGSKRGLREGDKKSMGEKKGKTKRKDHAASWLNEHGQRMITIEYIMLLLVEAIN